MYTGQGLVDDFLAFGYDTGASLTTNAFYSPSRFYKGEPTTNLGPIDLASWGTEGSAQRIATGRTYRDQPTYNCRTTVGEVYRGIDNTISKMKMLVLPSPPLCNVVLSYEKKNHAINRYFCIDR